MQIISTEEAPRAIGPYSQAILVGNWLYTSGQVGLDPATGELVGRDFSEQARRAFENLKAVLAAAGMDFHHVVKATVYLTDMSDFQPLNRIYTEFMGEHKPARSTVAVAALPKDALVEIDLVAVK